jgi:hypothetical protein
MQADTGNNRSRAWNMRRLAKGGSQKRGKGEYFDWCGLG